MLALNEWEQSHNTGALDRAGQLTLMRHADFRTFARDNLRKGRKEAPQNIYVLVIHVVDIVVAEVALLLSLNNSVCFFHKVKTECLRS